MASDSVATYADSKSLRQKPPLCKVDTLFNELVLLPQLENGVKVTQ